MRATDATPANLPLPPPELMARVGRQLPPDKQSDGELGVADWYLLFGRRLRDSVLGILPPDFNLGGSKILDFGCGSGRVLRHLADRNCELWGCDLDTESIEWLQGNLADTVKAFENPSAPPIDLPDGSFDLILALSVFTHLTDDWSDWLLELHRLVRPGGYVVASFIGPAMAGEMTDDSLGEGDIGMNSIGLGRGFSRGSGPLVFHSHWWLHAHWGRAFEILELEADGFGRPHAVSQGAVLMRRKEVELSRDDLEWPEPGETRELASRRVNTRQLRAEAHVERRRYVNEGKRKAEAGSRGTASDDDAFMAPILVDCVGRGGSTLMMQLLRCSPQVRVEGPFPYERRYFAYFYRWAQLLGKSEWPKDLWGNPELARGARWDHSIIGPPPWAPDPMLTPPGDPMSEPMLRAAWQDFSRRVGASQEGGIPTYYAEKSVDTHRLDLRPIPEAHLLIVVRDPRDTFVSIEAFNAKRGRAGFGRGDLSDSEFLEAFIERHRHRMEWLSSLDSPLVIRYEDVVEDAAQAAQAVSENLSIEFIPAELGMLKVSSKPGHVTAESIAGSVGRWRTELDPQVEATMRRALQTELEALGYEA